MSAYVALSQNHSAPGSPILTLALTEVLLATSEPGPAAANAAVVNGPLLLFGTRDPRRPGGPGGPLLF